jgi:nucleoside-diphosphate-sugar epimerase
MRHAVIVGASGIIGGNLLRHLADVEGWRITGICRRPIDRLRGVNYVAVDLLDAAEARRAVGALDDATHLFYAGFAPASSWAAHVAPNLALLANAVDALESAAPNLEHACLVQGTKYYGAHLGPYKTPAKETDPRHMPPNFYYDQQDFLAARQKGKRWNWSAVRPQAVTGFAVGNPMNLLNVVAAYAAISKELGVPLRFPGKPGHFHALMTVTDAALLARAMVWAATTPSCAGEPFNITNGDHFRWENLWPRIAAVFEMPTGPVQTIDLVEFMADKERLWAGMVERHGLQPRPWTAVASWAFGNYALGMEYDHMSDTTKCRRYGFQDCINSEERLLEQLADMRRARLVP